MFNKKSSQYRIELRSSKLERNSQIAFKCKQQLFVNLNKCLAFNKANVDTVDSELERCTEYIQNFWFIWPYNANLMEVLVYIEEFCFDWKSFVRWLIWRWLMLSDVVTSSLHWTKNLNQRSSNDILLNQIDPIGWS